MNIFRQLYKQYLLITSMCKASADLQTELFAPLKEIEAFKEACTVMNGTLAWDLSGNRDEANCIDIDPFTLYELDSINNLIA